jgi:pantothenate kinase
MQKYITILEVGNEDCPNVGTIATGGAEHKFKEAIESHFDAELISFSFVDEGITHLTDCISASPIDVLVRLDVGFEQQEFKVELSQTWLY